MARVILCAVNVMLAKLGTHGQNRKRKLYNVVKFPKMNEINLYSLGLDLKFCDLLYFRNKCIWPFGSS